jgi:hypothetical protein
MSNVPEGAQRSPDGHWWWDGQQWLLVEEDGAPAAAAAAGADPERVAARLEHGYPAAVEHLTDEQKTALLGQPVHHSETLAMETVNVDVMEGHEEATS